MITGSQDLLVFKLFTVKLPTYMLHPLQIGALACKKATEIDNIILSVSTLPFNANT